MDLLSGFFSQNVLEQPAFPLAERAAFHDPDQIALARLVFLVVRHAAGLLFDILLHDGMLDEPVHHHGDGLVGLVAHDPARQPHFVLIGTFSRIAHVHASTGCACGFLSFFLMLISVKIRAIRFLAFRISAVFSV
jgi:hypothetical protein